ncbi:MAG: hypothetical protein JW819_09485 [Candidatus Krumholzibacteriota bacterium]|nr:hypothetical protein [Candidatus Krumholzibacteriota bacterium]
MSAPDLVTVNAICGDGGRADIEREGGLPALYVGDGAERADWRFRRRALLDWAKEREQ